MIQLPNIGLLRFSLLCLLISSLLNSPLQAQVEVISAQKQQQYLEQFPAVIQKAVPKGFQSYLRQLQVQLKQSPATADGQTEDGQYSSARNTLVRQIITASRVLADLGEDAKGDAPLSWYVVPPMSPVIRLANEYPQDGAIAAPITLVAAQDEYEPASFTLYPFVDAKDVTLEVTDLKSTDGHLFPKDRLDLKVVKIWYQNGNGWFSYFADPGLVLVPELLLHDENLIRVDTKKKANYARVKDAKGSHDVWISAPHDMEVGFDHYDAGFVDADTLAPVSLQQGEFKQFMLTAHVTQDTAAGIYHGSIHVNTPGHSAVVLPVTLRVLPLKLPLPHTYGDVSKPFLVSLMGSWPVLAADHPAMLPTLKNQRAHNLLHTAPGLNQNSPAKAQELVAVMKEAGFETSHIIHRHGFGPFGNQARKPMTWDELMSYDLQAKKWFAFYQKNFGHPEVYVGFGDEPGTSWIMNVRPFWRLINENGLKSQVAGHEALLTKGGYILNLHQSAGFPSQEDHARPHNQVGFGEVAFYAGQHIGVENPAYVRRQHGLLGYLSGFTAVHNYQFAFGPWNDQASWLYKPMVLAYPISNGVVDTLAWEGFREGIDDIRYATALLQLAHEAAGSKNWDRIYAGRKVLLWFALMDGSSVDLSLVRLEMVDKILELKKLEAGK